MSSGVTYTLAASCAVMTFACSRIVPKEYNVPSVQCRLLGVIYYEYNEQVDVDAGHD